MEKVRNNKLIIIFLALIMLFSFYYLNVYSSSELPNKVDKIIKRNRITNYSVEDVLYKEDSNFLSKMYNPDHYESYKIKDQDNNSYFVIFRIGSYNDTYIFNSDEKMIHGMIDDTVINQKYWNEF